MESTTELARRLQSATAKARAANTQYEIDSASREVAEVSRYFDSCMEEYRTAGVLDDETARFFSASRYHFTLLENQLLRKK